MIPIAQDLRILRRTNPSSMRNVGQWLCLKYSNQPLSAAGFDDTYFDLMPVSLMILA
jgi:hypothetical protein